MPGERDELEDYLVTAMTDPAFRAAYEAADDDEPDDECDGGDHDPS